MNLFEPKSPANGENAVMIRAWVSARFGLEEDAVIMVSELSCTEPGCPPLHTIIAIMGAPGERRRFKIHKGIADVVVSDVDSLEVS